MPATPREEGRTPPLQKLETVNVNVQPLIVFQPEAYYDGEFFGVARMSQYPGVLLTGRNVFCMFTFSALRCFRCKVTLLMAIQRGQDADLYIVSYITPELALDHACCYVPLAAVRSA